MIWSQAVVKGRLGMTGAGAWSGETFKASVIEIGGQSFQGVSVAKCLLEHMEAGDEMELLICSAHIYGVRINGQTFKEGAMRQMGWALLVMVVLGWIYIPLAAASLIFIRRSFTIHAF